MRDQEFDVETTQKCIFEVSSYGVHVVILGQKTEGLQETSA
jgi:hypothetical protein